MNSEVAASDDEQLTDNVPGTRLSFQEEFVILDEESVGDLDVSLDDIFATDPTNQVKMKSRAPPGNAEDMLRASEFEKGSLTPDSPFSGLHLESDDDKSSVINFSPIMGSDEDEGEEKKANKTSDTELQVSLALKSLESPRLDRSELVLTSSPNKAPTTSTGGAVNPRVRRLRKTNDYRQVKGWQSKCTPPPSSTDEAESTGELLLCDTQSLPDLLLSTCVNTDPLALPNSSSPSEQTSPATKRRKLNPTENSPSILQEKKVSLDKLFASLADVAHCNDKDVATILKKATATINKLRHDANDLMSTYSQLKLQNEELFQSKLKLTGAAGLTTDATPAWVPTSFSLSPFDSSCLNEELPDYTSENTTLPLEPPVEDYADECGPASPSAVGSCKRFFCRLGCICDSLSARKQPADHCRHSVCMLEPECMGPQVEPLPVPISSFVQKKRRAPLVPDSPRPDEVPDLAHLARLSDPKLSQRCCVRLKRLPAHLIFQLVDEKLKPRNCAVRLHRLSEKEIGRLSRPSPKPRRKRGRPKGKRWTVRRNVKKTPTK